VLVTFVPKIEPGIETSSFHRALGEVVRTRPGIALLTEEEAFAEGNDATRELKRCGPELACLQALLTRRAIELALLLVVDTRLDPPLVSVELVRAQGAAQEPGPAQGTARESQEPGHARGAARESRLVQEAARSELALVLPSLMRRALDQGGLVEGAELSIAVEPIDANISIAGLDPGVVLAPGARRIVLPAGAYEIVATHAARTTERRRVELARGEVRSVSIVLAAPIVERAVFEEWWFWVGVGVVVAGAATASTWAITREPGSSCVCAKNEPASCPPGC
jgi:hypothetical protein